MRQIVCPEVLPEQDDSMSVFLAGGIVGCADWQSEIIELLSDCDVTLFNPRRPNFPINDPTAAPQQIKWEFDALRKAGVISFWFDSGTVQPIVMFEYGYWLSCSMNFDAKIFIGCHPDYPRRLDVEEQTRLACAYHNKRVSVQIVYSLAELAAKIKEYAQ